MREQVIESPNLNPRFPSLVYGARLGATGSKSDHFIL